MSELLGECLFWVVLLSVIAVEVRIIFWAVIRKCADSLSDPPPTKGDAVSVRGESLRPHRFAGDILHGAFCANCWKPLRFCRPGEYCSVTSTGRNLSAPRPQPCSLSSETGSQTQEKVVSE